MRCRGVGRDPLCRGGLSVSQLADDDQRRGRIGGRESLALSSVRSGRQYWGGHEPPSPSHDLNDDSHKCRTRATLIFRNSSSRRLRRQSRESHHRDRRTATIGRYARRRTPATSKTNLLRSPMGHVGRSGPGQPAQPLWEISDHTPHAPDRDHRRFTASSRRLGSQELLAVS